MGCPDCGSEHKIPSFKEFAETWIASIESESDFDLNNVVSFYEDNYNVTVTESEKKRFR